MEQLKTKYKIESVYFSPYHHNTVGAVERLAQTFMNKLKKLTNFGTTLWKEQVKQATNAKNISFHAAIDMSPHFLKYDKQPILQLDFERCVYPGNITKKVLRIRDKRWDRYVNKNIEKSLRTISDKLKIGDPALIFRPKKRGNSGITADGFKVFKKTSEDAYEATTGNFVKI